MMVLPMSLQRRFISTATAAVVFCSMAATRFVAGHTSSTSSLRHTQACSLLTTAEASTALGLKSLPGAAGGDSTMCVWSNDPNQGYDSPRIMLSTRSLRSFQAARHPNITTIKVEPISGIGDEAFFQVYPDDTNPFIWARKGSVGIAIRLITIPPKAFTLDQEKSKEMVLMKAALARL